jgi:hypothetical protein
VPPEKTVPEGKAVSKGRVGRGYIRAKRDLRESPSRSVFDHAAMQESRRIESELVLRHRRR